MNARGTIPAPTAPFSDWPARRAERITYTRAGIGIGAAYIAPPPRPSDDAERIQAALIARRERSWKRAQWCVYAIATGVAFAALMGVLR